MNEKCINTYAHETSSFMIGISNEMQIQNPDSAEHPFIVIVNSCMYNINLLIDFNH